jgi:hypothetical protein
MIRSYMLYFPLALNVLLNLAIIVALIRAYLRSRNNAFVWLGVSVILWPFVDLMLRGGEHMLVERIQQHQPVIWPFWPFSIFENGRMTLGSLLSFSAMTRAAIGAGLMLVAVLQLSKASAVTNQPAVPTSVVNPGT